MFGTTFNSYLELNLERERDAALFKKGLTAKELLSAIFLYKNMQPKEDNSVLLFIDEIQNSPEALNSLRFFNEDLPDLPVIAAGSLLEIIINRKHLNVPVGRVQYHYMYPLSFQEFLGATRKTGLNESFGNVPSPDYANDLLLREFHAYAAVGGMPEIVAEFARSGNLAGLNSIYVDLMRAYQDDIPKYASNDSQAAVLRHCFETAPLEAGRRVTFAGFGRSNYRSRETGEALRALEQAMLLYLCYPTTSVTPPAQADLRKSPRLQFIDIGLLNHTAGIQSQYVGIKDLNELYRGITVEQIVGQELLAIGATELRKPQFWVRESPQSNAQVDYLVPFDGKLVPVEVKAGAAGTLRSLHQFMDACPHNIAVRLWAGKRGVVETRTVKGKPFKLLNLPYCFAAKVKEYIGWAFG
jgi:predicted AAA+ superfamily ATPase